MDERDILQHLLSIESEAADLALDAQAEAERRVAECEKSSRENYAVRYGERVSELEAVYGREAAAIIDEYRKVLQTYRAGLEKRPVDHDRFAALAAEMLTSGVD